MKVDGGLGNTPDIATIIANAKAQEAAGYDGVWTAETSHDFSRPSSLLRSTPNEWSSARRSLLRSLATQCCWPTSGGISRH